MWTRFDIFHISDIISRCVVVNFVCAHCCVDFVCVFLACILMSFVSEYFFWFGDEGQFKMIYYILLCVWTTIVVGANVIAHDKKLQRLKEKIF